MPDKVANTSDDKSKEEVDNENEEFINAAHMAFSSPNPNFIVLDRELLENFSQENQAFNQPEQLQQQQIVQASSIDKAENATNKEANESETKDVSEPKESESEA